MQILNSEQIVGFYCCAFTLISSCLPLALMFRDSSRAPSTLRLAGICGWMQQRWQGTLSVPILTSSLDSVLLSTHYTLLWKPSLNLQSRVWLEITCFALSDQQPTTIQAAFFKECLFMYFRVLIALSYNNGYANNKKNR